MQHGPLPAPQSCVRSESRVRPCLVHGLGMWLHATGAILSDQLSIDICVRAMPEAVLSAQIARYWRFYRKEHVEAWLYN